MKTIHVLLVVAMVAAAACEGTPLADTDYLLGVLAHYFPTHAPTVVDRFAGLRVLPRGAGDAFRRPRDCVLHVDPRHPRLLCLSGGKLTGYRTIAQRVVQRVRAALGANEAIADTATLRLPAGQG